MEPTTESTSIHLFALLIPPYHQPLHWSLLSFLLLPTQTTSLVAPPPLCMPLTIKYVHTFITIKNRILILLQGDSLGTVVTPNAGVYTYIANLSQITGPATGFDIFGAANSAVAALQVDGLPYFVAIDVTTAVVSFIASPGMFAYL